MKDFESHFRKRSSEDNFNMSQISNNLIIESVNDSN